MVIQLEVETEMFPTEEKQALEKTLLHLYPFDNLNFSEPNDKGIIKITGKAVGFESLKFLFTQVRKQQIVETVRNWAFSQMNLTDNFCEIKVNKQALYQGFIALSTEEGDSPLGPVSIRISAKKIEPVINYLFAHTEKGKVIEVDYKPTE